MTDVSYELYVERGPYAGTSYPLANKSLTLGRDPLSSIHIDDPEVSRQHALVISVAPDKYQIQDLGSMNGTFVDGQRLGSDLVTLRPPSIIKMGSRVVLVFRVGDKTKRAVSPKESSSSNTSVAGNPRGESGATPRQSSASQPRSTPLEENRDMVAAPSAGMTQREEALTHDGSVEQVDPLRRQPKEDQKALVVEQQLGTADPSLVSSVPMPGSHADNDPGEGLSANLILGAVLLLLCCGTGILLFLIFWGGDWLFRLAGLVP